MAVDLERLVVTLSADIRQYERTLQKMNGVTSQRTRAIQTQFSRMNRSMTADFMTLGKVATGVFAAISTARGLKSFSDAATRIDNALKVAGLSGAELEKVYQSLFASAQKNAAPLESLVMLYGRAAMAQKELNVNQDEMVKFADNVAKALRVSGQSAEASRGALIQLSQAIGAGIVRAEEFNAILEGALPIAQATARGLKEAGGSVAALRRLIIDGKVSSEAFFRAFEAGAPMLEEKVAGATFTIDQALGNLNTSLTDAFREFNQATGASENFAKGIDGVALAIGRLDVSGFIKKIQDAKNELDGLLRSAGNANIFEEFNRLAGITDAEGGLVNPNVAEAEQKIASLETEITNLQAAIQNNTKLGFDNSDALARLRSVRFQLATLQAEAANLAPTIAGIQADGTQIPFAQTNGLMGGSTIRGGARRPVVNTVSLDDFANPAGTKTKGGAAKANEYDEAVKAANEATTALVQQEAALRSLNGASADYASKVAAVEKAQELLTAAQKGGREVGKELSDINQLLYGDLSKLSPEAQKQAAAIRNLSLSYADATTKLDALKEAQEKAAASAREAIEFQKDLVNGALSDMRTALEDGKLTWEDLGNVAVNVLNKIADKLQTMLVDQLFAQGFGGLFGSLGGGLGAVVGGVSGAGGAAVGKVAASNMMAKAPSVPSPAMMAKGAQQQGVHVTVGLVKNGLNLEAEVVNVSAKVSKAIVDENRRGQLHQDIQKHMKNPRVRGR